MSFKKLIQFVFTIIIFVGAYQPSMAQNFQSLVSSSLSYGNIKDLTKNFDKRVQVTIDSKTDYFSNSQAEIIVSNYVNQLGNKDFNLIKSGNAEGGTAEFYIGEIRCSRGNVKVYIYLRKVGDTPYIQEVRLEKN
ncbi:MAG: DUF4783 domain-containing protein [Chitinophagales bacterium]|nr:DUF4783 domain-containing protein [Chitinophagales bacterium]